MLRTTTKKQLNTEESSYRVKYVENCSAEARKHVAYKVLTELSQNPGLLDTGPVFFETLKMYWDGNSWVVELEGRD